MIARPLAILVLLFPLIAKAEFKMEVTQVGPGSPQDDEAPYPGACAMDACRATVPLLLGDDICILNVRVGAPSSAGWGQIQLAIGPCRSGRVRSLPPATSPARYHLDSFGATSIMLALPIEPPRWMGIEGLDDGVRHAEAAVQIDIIATTAH